MDEPTWKALPCREGKKGKRGAHHRFDRLGIVLGDPADRGPPEEVKRKGWEGNLSANS